MQTETLGWFKTLPEYYHRKQWELFDIVKDPTETINLVDNAQYFYVLTELKDTLFKWQVATDDPWRCWPQGLPADSDKCTPLLNDT